jgi:hypothetical protein
VRARVNAAHQVGGSSFQRHNTTPSVGVKTSTTPNAFASFDLAQVVGHVVLQVTDDLPTTSASAALRDRCSRAAVL